MTQALGLLMAVGGIVFSLILRSWKKQGHRDVERVELWWPVLLVIFSVSLVWQLWVLMR